MIEAKTEETYVDWIQIPGLLPWDGGRIASEWATWRCT